MGMIGVGSHASSTQFHLSFQSRVGPVQWLKYVPYLELTYAYYKNEVNALLRQRRFPLYVVATRPSHTITVMVAYNYNYSRRKAEHHTLNVLLFNYDSLPLFILSYVDRILKKH